MNSTNSINNSNIQQIPQNQFGFQNNHTTQGFVQSVQPNLTQFPPGMFPANYFPFIAPDAQMAFKKKLGYS